MPVVLTLNMRTLHTDKAQSSIKKVTHAAEGAQKGVERVGNAAQRTSKDIQELSRSLDITTRSLDSLKAFAKRAVAALGLEETVRRSLAAFADYQSSLANLGKVTDENLTQVDDKIRGIDASLGSYSQLAQGYYQVISAGVTDSAQAMELLETASKTGAAAQVSQADSIRALTSLLTGYAGELKNSADAADLLFAIERYGKTSVQELVPYIGELASVSRIAGVSANDMGASFSVITQTAGSTATASTQLKALFVELARNGDSLKKILDDLGQASFQTLIEKEGSLGNALKALDTQTRKTGQSFTTLFSSQEAQLAARNILDLYSGFENSLAGIEKRTGSVDAAFGRYSETIRGLGNTTRNLADDLATRLGEALSGPASEGLKIVNSGLSTLSDNFEVIKSATPAVVAGLLTLAAVRSQLAQETRQEGSSLAARTKAAIVDIATTKEQVVQQARLRAELLKVELEAFKTDAIKRYGQEFSRASALIRQSILNDIKALETEVAVANGMLTKLEGRSKVLVTTSSLLSRAFTGLRSLGSRVVSFFGGPWNFALIGATSALTYLATRQTEGEKIAERYAHIQGTVSEALQRTKDAANETANAVDKLTLSQTQTALEQAKKDVAATQSELYRIIGESKNRNSVVDSSIAPFRDALAKLEKQLQSGKVDFAGLAHEIDVIGAKTGEGGLSGTITKLISNYEKAQIAESNYRQRLEENGILVDSITEKYGAFIQVLNTVVSTMGRAGATIQSLPGMDKFLTQTKITAYLNKLPSEVRGAASSIQSQFKLSLEQLDSLVKGTFEGFTKEDAAALQQAFANLKTPKLGNGGASQITSAREQIARLREEIERLNGTGTKGTADLTKTLREIDLLGAKAKLAPDAIRELKNEYAEAFKTDVLQRFDEELLKISGDTKAIQLHEITEQTKAWRTELDALVNSGQLSAEEAGRRMDLLSKGLEKQKNYKDLQAASNFYREYAELSGDFTTSQKLQNQLIEEQVVLLKALSIPQQYIDDWKELQRLQTSREGWDGATRAARKFYSDASNYAQGFEEISSQALNGFSSTLTSVLWKADSDFGDFFKSLGQMVTEFSIRASMAQILGGLFTPSLSGAASQFSNAFTASNNIALSAWGFHSGGTVGYDSPTFGRSVPLETFAGAPRLHSGGGYFGPDEYPAILQTGERVLSRRETSLYDAFSGYHSSAERMRDIMDPPWKRNIETSLAETTREYMNMVRESRLEAARERSQAAMPKINFIVNTLPGTEVEQEQSPNSDGGMDVVATIKRINAQDAVKRGGQMNNVLRKIYNVQPITTRR